MRKGFGSIYRYVWVADVVVGDVRTDGHVGTCTEKQSVMCMDRESEHGLGIVHCGCQEDNIDWDGKTVYCIRALAFHLMYM